MVEITVPISVGELLDKIAILEIKAERIGDVSKRANILKELGLLLQLREGLDIREPDLIELINDLSGVNRRLWDIEDRLRELEQRADFGAEFVRLARSVYQENDLRAALKRRLNVVTGSALIEEKSYSSG